MIECKKAVLFAAHSDDEMICAGTLHRLVQQGVDVSIVTLGPAATERDRTGTKVSSVIVYPEWQASLKRIGANLTTSTFLNLLPTRDLPEMRPEICQAVYDWVEQHKPDTAFILSPDDENTAHRVLGEECERVLRGRVALTIRCQFPWNYSIGRGNLFVELNEAQLACKQDVIQCYRSQHFRYDYLRMLEHYVRGDGLSVKKHAAEKFEIIRCVV